MKKGDLTKFFSPKNIAVIGASSHNTKVGGILMEKLQTFKGEIIPINPKHSKILNKRSYPNLKSYKRRIDLAIIAIPAKFVNDALQQCGKKKIKNAIIISAGFSERGNNKLQNQIISTAKRYKIQILGPNCFGIVNTATNLDCTFSNSTPKRGSTAFISQSGALWSYISDFPETKISSFVSLGNQSMLTFSDFIEYFNKDKKTKRIVLYVEKLKQGRKFIEICRKSKKPIMVIKAGKTEKGTQATISHTGSLATDYEVYKGAFKQAKVKVIENLAEAFGIKKQNLQLKNTKEINLIGNAGGAIALLTDDLTERGIKVKSKDLLGTALASDYKKALKKSKKKTIVILTPQRMSQPEEVAKLLKKKDIAVFLGDKSMTLAKKRLKSKAIKYYNRII